MDFFLSRTDSTITPASLAYFAIFDPSLTNEDDESNDNSDQLLVYLPTEDGVHMNTKIRRIGLISGMNDFCLGFDKNDKLKPLQCVELENSRIFLKKFEDRYNIILAVNLTKVDEDDGTTVTYDETVPLKFYSDLIVEGYNEFRLHNGTIESLYQTMERDEFVNYLERWWSVWYSNYQLELTEDGFMKQYEQFYHKSSLKLDSEVKYSVDRVHENSQFKEFLVWNSEGSDNFGLVYEHFKNMESDSKTRLLKWLELTSYYGISTDTLVANNITKNQPPRELKHSDSPYVSEFVYDPFKLMFDTITDVSKKTGITTGVNYGVKTMTSGLSAMNSYIPMPWGSTTPTAEEGQSQNRSSTTITPLLPDSSVTPFLVGKVNETSISYKNLYLKFQDDHQEALHRLVIYRYEKHLILMIYPFNANQLNESTHYDTLGTMLTKLCSVHLPKLNDQDPKKKRLFYFIGVDPVTRTIESSFPYIPRTDFPDLQDDNSEDHKYDDLSINKAKCQLMHKELTTIFNNIDPTGIKERLNITRNGWWVYNINSGSKTVFILKKLKRSPGNVSQSSGLLDISANVHNILGKEANSWINNYINGY